MTVDARKTQEEHSDSMAEGTAEERPYPSPLWGIGGLPVLLLVAAGLQFVLTTLVRSAISYEDPLDPTGVAWRLVAASGFALAAAIVAGNERWPAARSWLLAAAFLFAAHGILEVLGELWLWWTHPGDVVKPVEGFNDLLLARALTSVVSAAAAPLLAAVGLWRALPTSAGRSARRWAIVGVLLLGVGSLVTTAPLAVRMAELDQAGWYEIAYYPLVGLASAGFGAIAAAALHRLPAHYRLPELMLAAGGALVAAAGAGWGVATSIYALAGFENDVSWLLTLSNLVQLAGLLTVVGGFFVARIVPPRGARPPERAW